MTKFDNLHDPNSCWNKARDDEPVFILLQRDPCAAEAVVAWINARISKGINQQADHKILSAREWASKAFDYHEKEKKKKKLLEQLKQVADFGITAEELRTQLPQFSKLLTAEPQSEKLEKLWAVIQKHREKDEAYAQAGRTMSLDEYDDFVASVVAAMLNIRG